MNNTYNTALRLRVCRLIFSLLSSACILLIYFDSAIAEELEMINRPVNASGLTGLLFTTSPFTIPAKSVELTAAVLSEKSTVPDYSINQLPLITITAGVKDNMELALKSSHFQKTTGGGNKERGTGDTELSYKWNFLPQNESSSLPALALVITGIGPTSNKEMNFGTVSHWGARFGLSAGREIIWGDHVIGIYADGQVAVQDLSDERIRDRYGILNTGLLFPISKYRNLQMLLEYSMVTGSDRIADQGGDYSAITYGLRLVSERFNLSIGTQFLHKQIEGFDDSSRIVGTMGIKL